MDVIQWAYYRLEEQKEERLFLAQLHGAKVKGSSNVPSQKRSESQAPLANRLSSMLTGSKGSKMALGRKHVSKEELEERRKNRKA